MSWADPDHLPPALPGCGPDADDSGTCAYCDGSGIDEDMREARGYIVDCEHCGGTGCYQELSRDERGDDSLVDDL
jgi:DnaJ-class molecular chaperone